MLGRCEILDDIFIAGNFDVFGIKCNSLAKIKTREIDKMFDEKLKLEQEEFETSTTISYLNVRSIQALSHHIQDVLKEPYLMKSDVFALGETWLSEGEERALVGFHDAYNSSGRGKGLAVYSKESIDSQKFTSKDGTACAILVKIKSMNVIFLYLSQNFDWPELQLTLAFWITSKTPTVILGDVNWHFDNNHPMKIYLEKRGFQQCIERSTHEGGHKIDHLYLSSSVCEKFTFKVLHQSVHFSDHDVIGIQLVNKTL